MDVGDFFEFERALLGDGVINTPAEEQGVVALIKCAASVLILASCAIVASTAEGISAMACFTKASSSMFLDCRRAIQAINTISAAN